MSNHDHTQNLCDALQTISNADLATATGATGGAITQQLTSFAMPFAQPVLDFAMPLAQPVLDLAMPFAQPFLNLATPVVDTFNKFIPAI